jgi:hypothetical protein
MANSQLRNTYYPIPQDIADHCKETLDSYGERGKRIDGYRRLYRLSQDNKISYEALKRIKNFFDNFKGDTSDDKYIMNGGDKLRNWVERKLSRERESIYNRKRRNKMAGEENQFISNHEKAGPEERPQQPTTPVPEKSADEILFNDNENLKENKKPSMRDILNIYRKRQKNGS